MEIQVSLNSPIINSPYAIIHKSTDAHSHIHSPYFLNFHWNHKLCGTLFIIRPCRRQNIFPFAIVSFFLSFSVWFFFLRLSITWYTLINDAYKALCFLIFSLSQHLGNFTFERILNDVHTHAHTVYYYVTRLTTRNHLATYDLLLSWWYAGGICCTSRQRVDEWRWMLLAVRIESKHLN